MENNICVSCLRNEGSPRRLFPQEVNPEFPRGKIMLCKECVGMMPINYFRLVEISSLYISSVDVNGRKVLVRQSCIPELCRQIILSLWKRSTAPTYADMCEILNLAQIDAPTGTEWNVGKLFSFLKREGINKDEIYAHSKLNTTNDSIDIELMMEKVRTLPEQIFVHDSILLPPKHSVDAQTEDDEQSTVTITYLRQMPEWESAQAKEPEETKKVAAHNPVQFIPTPDELERVLKEWEEG